MGTLDAPLLTGTKAEMVQRLTAAQRDLDHRQELCDLALELRNELVVMAVDHLGMTHLEVATAIGKGESTVRKVVAAS